MNPTSKELGDKIIAIATDFIGLGEVESNSHWDDPRTKFKDTDKDVWLRSWMRKFQGWTPGAPYCAAFAGACAAAALKGFSLDYEKFIAAWTAHCMTNVRALSKKKLLSASPVAGSLWLARHGTTDSGHAGIVQQVFGDAMATIEANTNDAGGREGDGIFTKKLPVVGRGKLATQGFLTPASILKLIS